MIETKEAAKEHGKKCHESLQLMKRGQSEFYTHFSAAMNACWNRLDAMEEATKVCKLMCDEIKALSERVTALEQAKEPKPYGLWHLKEGYWHSSSPFESAGEASRYASKTFYADWRNYWRVYPYPEDGGKPMELRETPVTVSPGGTNYVYDQPKLPTLWGVWLEQDNRWAGSNIGEGSIAFFRSKDASEKYAFACGGEARPLPIEELVKDA